jgi:hypothetical protein
MWGSRVCMEGRGLHEVDRDLYQLWGGQRHPETGLFRAEENEGNKNAAVSG